MNPAGLWQHVYTVSVTVHLSFGETAVIQNRMGVCKGVLAFTWGEGTEF
jgi:hypothetical protein